MKMMVVINHEGWRIGVVMKVIVVINHEGWRISVVMNLIKDALSHTGYMPVIFRGQCLFFCSLAQVLQ